jgi:branched-chain amino acid aminotransferase
MAYNINIQRVKESRLSDTDFNNIPFGHVFSDHMFIADYKNGEWTDCRILPYGNLSLSPANTTLHYAQTVFEGMKAMRGTADADPLVFRLDAHANRMAKSCARMGMPDLPIELFTQAIETLVSLDADWVPNLPNTSLYIRPFVFGTDEFLGVRPSDTYRFMVITGPVGAYYAAPVKLFASNKYVRAFEGGTGEAKTGGNYAATLKAVREIRAKGYDQLLWMDGIEHKHIHESGTMNIFFVIDGKIITPALNGCILHGITRDSILTILQEKNMPHEVRDITIDEIVAAHKAGTLQEVFGAGTAAVVQHVSHIAYGDDYVMELPSVDNRPISTFLYNEITNIRAGEIKDTHNWVTAIRASINENTIA